MTTLVSPPTGGVGDRTTEPRAIALRLAALALVLGAATFVAYRAGWFDYHHVVRWAGRLRRTHDIWLSATIFVGVWGVASSAGFPGLPLMIAGGFLFGTLLGTALNMAGTAIGAAGGYYIARTIGRDTLQRWLADHLPIARFTERRHGAFLTMVRFRLLPVLPMAIGNFGAGLAGMDFWPYLGGTLVGQFPSTLIYTYFADAIVGAVTGARLHAVWYAGASTVLLLILTLVPRVWMRRR